MTSAHVSSTTTSKLSRGSLLGGILLAAAIAAPGCAAKDEPTEQDYNDVAQALGSMVAGNGSEGEVAEMGTVLNISAGDMPEGLTLSGSGSVQGQRGSLDYSFSIDCLDANGDAQAQCDESTDSAAVAVDWSGAIDWATFDASVSRDGNWTLTDIQSGTAVFNGEGNFSFDSEFMSLDGQRTRTFSLDYAANYDDILIDVATHQLQGGTASYSISAARTGSNQFRDVEAEFDIDAVLTFNGDGSATLVLDGSHSYQLDLNNGIVIGQ